MPAAKHARENVLTSSVHTLRSPAAQLRVAWLTIAVLLIYISKGILLSYQEAPGPAPAGGVRIVPRRVSTMQVVSKCPRIVLFGDSLTQHGSNPHGGWVAALQDYYSRKADVINRGYSGYNTRFAQYVIPHILDEHMEPPLLMTFFFGANDATLPGRLGFRQHVPLSEYTQHLRSMVEQARQKGVKNAVLIAPPPVKEEGRIHHQVQVAVVVPEGLDVTRPDRTNEHTKRYAQAAVELAAELNMPCVDLHARMQEQQGWEDLYLLPDGLHFTSHGNMFVFDELVRIINQHLPHIRSEDLPFHFPPWNLVNVTNPNTTFTDVLEGRQVQEPPTISVDMHEQAHAEVVAQADDAQA